jgi:hypothetical protein
LNEKTITFFIWRAPGSSDLGNKQQPAELRHPGLTGLYQHILYCIVLGCSGIGPLRNRHDIGGRATSPSRCPIRRARPPQRARLVRCAKELLGLGVLPLEISRHRIKSVQQTVDAVARAANGQSERLAERSIGCNSGVPHARVEDRSRGAVALAAPAHLRRDLLPLALGQGWQSGSHCMSLMTSAISFPA